MKELTQEHLFTIIDRAIDLYQLCQPIKGMIPSSQQIQVMLKTCGLDVELSRITTNREIVLEHRSN
jgi:hypothetical protein